jgi:hypothetical protein
MFPLLTHIFSHESIPLMDLFLTNYFFDRRFSFFCSL